MGVTPPETRAALDPYTPERGDASYRVEHYDLDLDYKVAPNRLTGTATLTVRALEPVTSLRVDLVGLQATKVVVDGKPTKWTTRPQSIVVRLPRPLFTGATADRRGSRYGGTPSPTTTRWGTLGWEELAEGALVASQPTGAPTWFPCNDHPSSKATYRVTFDCDSPYDVAVTARLVSSRVRGSRTKRVFEQSHPTATYLMTVHVGHWTAHRIGEQPCPVWVLVPAECSAEALHDLARLPQMVAVLSELVGPYPFEDYTVVVTPDALDIPLEAQAMATFGANWLPGDRRHERLVAHELAHQWFGNSLTLGSWRDIWLHEGFACYAEWLWSQASRRLVDRATRPRAPPPPRAGAAGAPRRRPRPGRDVRRRRLQAGGADAARAAADARRPGVLRAAALLGGRARRRHGDDGRLRRRGGCGRRARRGRPRRRTAPAHRLARRGPAPRPPLTPRPRSRPGGA